MFVNDKYVGRLFQTMTCVLRYSGEAGELKRAEARSVCRDGREGEKPFTRVPSVPTQQRGSACTTE